jgi:hypothetical protein
MSKDLPDRKPLTSTVAFTPILNGGVKALPDYEFKCGVKLSATQVPAALDRAIKSLDSNEFVAPIECSSLVAAGGCLWIESNFQPQRSRDATPEITRLTYILRNVLWCIYLHPFGENGYWANTKITNCAVYVHGPFNSPIDAPRRFPFMFGVPNGEQGTTTGWSLDTLKSADKLMVSLESYPHVVPRVSLAGHIHRMMASVEVRQFSPVRLQLAVTALETFYIAPTEHAHMWSTKIESRVRKVCKSVVSIPPNFFEELREARNDVVHRAGLNPNGKLSQKPRSVLSTTECILRETMKFAIRNLSIVDKAFAQDAWPNIP